MYGVRKASTHSLASKVWSTTELDSGLMHLISDMEQELPDDLDRLKARPWSCWASGSCQAPSLTIDWSLNRENKAPVMYPRARESTSV